jgi:hypothetical protein
MVLSSIFPVSRLPLVTPFRDDESIYTSLKSEPMVRKNEGLTDSNVFPDDETPWIA